MHTVAAGGGASSVLGTTGFMGRGTDTISSTSMISQGSGGTSTSMGASSRAIDEPNTPMALTTSTGSISVNVGSNGRVEFARESQPSYQNVGLAVSSIQKSDGTVQVALIDAKPAQSYAGKQADGKDLPDWVKVDPTTGAITATPPAGQKAIVINITAKGDGKLRVLQVEVKFTDDKGDKGKGDNAQPAKGNKPQASAGEILTFSQQVDIAYNDYYGKGYGDRLIASLMG